MTGFRGWDETDQTIDPLTPAELRPLVQGAGASVTVASTTTDARAVARRTDGGGWRVRIIDAAQPPIEATTANADATFDLLRSWAAGDGWWEDAFTWTTVQPTG